MAHLALVAVDMKTPVKGHHPHGLLEARLGHDGLLADTAARGELFVEAVNAVDLVGRVHSEGNPVQGLKAYHAREARGVVGLARGAQNAVQNGLVAHTAFLEGVLGKGSYTQCWNIIKNFFPTNKTKENWRVIK